jgi:eukaryotic-like serine/threonine-protein kinase
MTPPPQPSRRDPTTRHAAPVHDPSATLVNGGPRAADAPAEPADDREDRLLAAIREYRAELDAGRRPNQREFLDRYSDLADDLAACLDGLAFVQNAAAEIPGAGGPPGNGNIDLGADLQDRGSADEPPIGQPLGDFRLVREIGRGGMGVVYEAVQLSLGRRVAVKVLPLAAALDRRQLQRFRQEAQAAA